MHKSYQFHFICSKTLSYSVTVTNNVAQYTLAKYQISKCYKMLKMASKNAAYCLYCNTLSVSVLSPKKSPIGISFKYDKVKKHKKKALPKQF